MIDSRVEPPTLLDQPCEQAPPAASSRAFTLKPRRWQSGFLGGALNDRRRSGFKELSDAAQQSCPSLSRPLAIFHKRAACGLRGFVDVFRRRPRIARLELCAGSGIDGAG